MAMRTVLSTLHSKFIHASLALPCMSAYCGKDAGEILIREFTVHEPRENVLAALLAESPDVVGFSVYLWNRRETLELADALVAARPGIRVVIGGPEVSYEDKQLFRRHPGVSALIRGEGEIPLKGLLAAWSRDEQPGQIPRLAWRDGGRIIEGPPGPSLETLDDIPSPFEGGLVDLSRPLIYYETSRGCPYRCSFCMSALDDRVRSFSMDRIRGDLLFLMRKEIPQVKLVDRTFNYDASRAREIFAFILEHNRKSRFHFEIGAHLLDDETLDLLEKVPPGVFQFEIGVQSTLEETLDAVGRRVSLERLEENVRRLRRTGNIRLHLDLIAGLPEENYLSFLSSIDRVAAMEPHHLQIEPVKLLPGSPLRRMADELEIRFDPHPPYSILGSPILSFEDLERLRGISRLMDLTWNSTHFSGFLDGMRKEWGSLSAGLEGLESFWRERNLFRHPLSRRSVFEEVWNFLKRDMEEEGRELLQELLARDFARSERVVPDNAPEFFDIDLTDADREAVRTLVRRESEEFKGRSVKIQHFAAIFRRRTEDGGRTLRVFIYLTRPGSGMEVREIVIR